MILTHVLEIMARQDKCANIVRLLGLNAPLLILSMVISNQVFIYGYVVVTAMPNQSFLYTTPESCIGLWLALGPATTAMVVCGLWWELRTAKYVPFHKQGD